VGSGARTVPICYFEAENNFWVSKMLKGHMSTVSAVAWHPSYPVVATACVDYYVRVYSAYLKNVDGKAVSTPWGDNPKFGTLIYSMESLGWVRNVAFSPTGETLAFCSHNSTVSFADVVSGAAPQVVRMRDLPLTHLLFLPDGSLVGVGHSYDPILFTRTPTGWQMAGVISGTRAEKKEGGAFANARNLFQTQSAQGQSTSAAAADRTAATMHSSLVCGMQLFGSTLGSSPAEFTTSALDGKVVFWSREEISAAMSALAIS